MKNIFRLFKWLFIVNLLLCGCVSAPEAIQMTMRERLSKLSRNAQVVIPDYPRKALEKGIEGEVIFDFDLDSTGHAIKIKIIKSEPPGVFDAEVLRAL